MKIFKTAESARRAAAAHRSTKGHYADVRHKDGKYVMYSGVFGRKKAKAPKYVRVVVRSKKRGRRDYD